MLNDHQRATHGMLPDRANAIARDQVNEISKPTHKSKNNAKSKVKRLRAKAKRLSSKSRSARSLHSSMKSAPKSPNTTSSYDAFMSVPDKPSKVEEKAAKWLLELKTGSNVS